MPAASKTRHRFTLPGALLLALLLTVPASAVAQQSGDNPQRERAEQQLREVLAGIEELRSQLEDARGEQQKEQARLRQLDLALQAANLELRNLRQQQAEHETEMQGLQHTVDVEVGEVETW